MILNCYRRKRPLPDVIKNAPDLLIGLELYFEAFIELNTTRQTGWGAGPIPTSAIYEYAYCLGLDEEETEDLLYLIRKMDEAFLQYMKRKSQDSS